MIVLLGLGYLLMIVLVLSLVRESNTIREILRNTLVMIGFNR